MCGKNFTPSNVHSRSSGSPPRVREKHPFRFERRTRFGITPACAGKTKSATMFHQHHRDHPRVCGKNYYGDELRTSAVGSPPRVREKLNQWVKAYQDFGITPACAGKTTRLICGKSNYRDHPRVCGKNNADKRC